MYIPLDDRVLVQPIAPDDKIGMIQLPATAQEKSTKGVVVSVGPGRVYDSGVRVAPTVKKGNVVLFERYSGTELKIAGEVYKVLRESELLLVEEV